MYTLGLGILLVVLKYLEIGPVAQWSWWWVLSPFAVTAAWWAWADATGYTKRRAMEKTDQRRQDRIDRHKEAMGVKPRRPR
ncbi:TIGR04438 family Trp-rich protein [Paracidovorax avenae]|uniref:TIGR04438 family Trp-rich protein n=1 Tax=Paracidovorax avenae TaxID=80867 RepID=UPI000D17BA95|nr:TIGR04438 family Trp-rich protein [Paracidovorax avenae]AVS77552.1 TIGR04438 family Trp-rich protein [Paracidovorax avenae]AVS80782.1 TIGR04438 family Trp-rich protein [Paracidovorax avenae]AVS84515.1 TIGR04438 family Trp-rich protein [Paracidovorax avenae]AVS87977.1 TIGR04438 family Trp-rich protein [Paracidovorax avenae]AVS91577.1 TIGR04438 family Trp-rich protein [Paracidovorax avenae]